VGSPEKEFAMQHSVPEIQLRLDRLERSNRRLKTTISACFLGAAAMILMGATSTAPKVIDAEKIILHDSAGNERGQLFASDNAWGLVLFNKNGTRATSLVVSAGLNGVLLCDQNGNVRQTITTNLEQSEWDIFHPGSDSAQFGVIDNGEGTALSFRNRANNPQVELGISSKGSALNLSDSNGGIRAMISGGEIGFASFTKDGSLEWAPGLNQFSPEEKKKIKALVPKLPN
jgi:hypothetical protein